MKKLALPLALVFALLSVTLAFAAGSVNLPGNPVSVTYSNWGSDPHGGMFTATLSGVGAGFDVTDGPYASYCVQMEILADTGDVKLYSSDDAAMLADAAGYPWDKVNYLLNHKAGAPWDVQQAIWVVLGQENIANVTPAAAAMAADALANGGGFVPAPGQKIAVILYSDGFGGAGDQFQETIIEVTVPDNACTDTDGDGVCDEEDNCPSTYNPDQADANGNGVGDACEPRQPGTGTPGYWKNHPEAWPVNSIMIGEDTYTKAKAISLMGKDSDKSYTMFRAYVAAYLNGLIGNDTSCVASELTAAYNWLNVNEPGSGVKAKSNAWKVGEPTATTLDNYNNGLLCAPHRN